MKRTKDLRVLLVAHHANPELTSEPLIGWRWAKELDRRTNLRLITHVRNRRAIEAAGGLRGEVLYVETERLARNVNQINDLLFPCSGSVNRLLLETIAQKSFDRHAVRIAKALVERGEVDLIHRVSPISPRYPSALGTLGVPFLIGPINGGLHVPPGFDKEGGFALHRLRSLSRLLDPLARTMTSADTIFVANEVTRRCLPKKVQDKCLVLSENAVEIDRFALETERAPGPLRLLYLGRLLRYKGVQYVLEAMRRLPAGLDLQLRVVGDGSYRRELEALARAAGLQDRVRFDGWITHDKVAGAMRECDVFVLPSVRESGGSVVLEAMAAGKPVLVADHGGPSETVRPEVGLKLSCESEEQLITGLVRSIAHLNFNEPRRLRMGRAARELVEETYTWQAKADRAIEAYRSALAKRRYGAGAPALQPALGTI